MKPLPLLGAIALLAFVVWRWRRLEWPVRVGAPLVVAGLTAYGFGLFELPNIEALIEDIGSTLGKWTYLAVGTLAFLETGAFVGLIAPGETAILVGGVVAGQGVISVVLLIAIVWSAAVAGDCASFYLGKRLGRGFLERHGPKVQITEARLVQVEVFFEKHGGKAILIGRFVGLVRAVAPFIAGSSGMKFRRFLPYDILGAGLWGTVFCLLGFIFWRSFSTVAEYAKTGAFALGTTIVVSICVIWLVRRFREPQERRRSMAWIDRQAERPLLRPFAVVARPVVRFAKGPVRFAWQRLTPGDLGLELTTLLAVAAVGAFSFAGNWVVLRQREFGTGDLWSLRRLNDISRPFVLDAAEMVTALGSFVVVACLVAVTAAVLVWRRHPWEAGVLVLGLVLIALGVDIVKDLEDRPRPLGALTGSRGSSFPSAHAAYAMLWVGCAVALARGVPWFVGRAAVVVAAVVLAAAIGASRVVLRVHFTSDVVAGWGLGAAILAVLGMGALVAAYATRQNGQSP